MTMDQQAERMLEKHTTNDYDEVDLDDMRHRRDYDDEIEEDEE